MATSVGTIAVNVTANTQKLARGLTTARSRVRRFGQSINRATRPLRTFVSVVGGVGTIGGIAGFAAGLKKASDEIDSIAKTSQKLGIATENLIGLQRAAELTGVQTRTLNMALQRMIRRVSEASKDTGEAKDAIKELGLNARELVKLAPDKQFARIADAMNRVENQADRVRLSFKLFDSEGVAVVNTLKLGSEGLAKVQREAERLGETFGGKAAAKVEQFNDAMRDLKATLGGQFRAIMIDIAPAAEQAVKNLSDIFQGIRGGRAAGKVPRGKPFSERALEFLDFGHGLEGTPGGRRGQRQGGILAQLRDRLTNQMTVRGQAVSKRELGAMGFGKQSARAFVAGRTGTELSYQRAKEDRDKEAKKNNAMFVRAFVPGAKRIKDAIVNAAKPFAQTLSKDALIARAQAAKKYAQSGNAFHRQLPLLTGMFGLDKVVENAQQQAASSGRRPANQALQANTMAGFTALRANTRGGEQKDMKALLKKQLDAIVTGPNSTNQLLLRVVNAIAAEHDLEPLVEIP